VIYISFSYEIVLLFQKKHKNYFEITVYLLFLIMFVQNEFKSLVCDFLSFFSRFFFCEITIVSIGLTIEFNFYL